MKFPAALSLVSLAFASAQNGIDTFKEQFNKNRVEGALTGLLIDRNPAAIEEFFDEDFVQHASNIPDGRDALIDYQASLPEDYTYSFGGIFAEGDFVFSYGRATGLEGGDLIVGTAYKLIDGSIVEGWQLTQPEVPADQTVSGNSMFPVTFDPVAPSPNEARNRVDVLEFNKRIFAFADADAVAYTSGDDYIQHNPTAPNGVNNSLLVIASLYEAGQITAVTGGAIADGDYVILFSNFFFPNYPGFEDPFFAFDVYRVDEAGVIVEHWDIIENEISIEQTVSENYQWPMF